MGLEHYNVYVFSYIHNVELYAHHFRTIKRFLEEKKSYNGTCQLTLESEIAIRK